MRTLTNEFSWSFTRHEIFQTCLKRYYFAYYASWGGWLDTAAPDVRLLYRLKRLSTRQQWAGHHIHLALEHLIRHSRHEATPETIDRIIEYTLDLMRREFRDSRSGACQVDPAHRAALFEHEYHVDIAPSEWKDLVDRVAAEIKTFGASPLWERLRTMPDDAILSVERRSTLMLDGLTLHVVPDLALREADGSLTLYDWKTGTSPLSEHRLQLGTYALLAMDRWVTDPVQIRAIAHHPLTQEAAVFTFTESDIEDLRGFIRDSADEMLFPLEDPEKNIAGDGSTFDCTEQDEPCATCSFLRVCPRWTSASPS